ncbi:MAG TPA: ABC transporter ATP-binding protein [Gemmatimonadaceae bacterium]|jgi:ABC-type multidrug transport system ATPase subunit|nr:ABC transporter ATP-binding protein [Gemmatimonadaceae bacterium]
MIECVDLTKTYQGNVLALDKLSLRAERGEVVGIAGPNGAGKSTLISLLLGYLHPTSGTVRLGGLAPRHYVEHYRVGYLSELIAMHPRWRVDEALARFALLAGVPNAEARAQIPALLSQLGLDEHSTKVVRALSKGNLQRLGLAQALLGDPDVLILDEPTHGLDPVWLLRFRAVMRDLRRPDRTMLIASHDLAELSALADRVYIIDHGQVVRSVDTRATATPEAREYRLTLSSGAALVPSVFPAARPASAEGSFELPAIDLATLNAGLAELLRGGAQLVSVAPTESLLEYHFRDAVEKVSA